MEGFAFNVKRCGDCEADAGTLKKVNDPGCFDGAREVFLKAGPVLPPTIPPGYAMKYILTEGYGFGHQSGFDDQAYVWSRSFQVGTPFIHLSMILQPLLFPGFGWDETTGADVLTWIDSENLCADLDPVGSHF